MMKYPAILVSLCLILAACAPIGADTTEQATTTTTAMTAITESTTPASQETTEYTVQDVYISYRDIYFNTLEEYNAYFAENEDIPLKVTFEKLRDFGAFYHFTFHSPAVLGDYSHYYYTLRDSVDCYFNLNIFTDHSYESYKLYDMLDPPIDGDLRRLDRPRSGYFFVDGILYFYYHGKLQNIRWESNSLSFELTVQEDFFTYPETSATFVGRMLSMDTAPGAVAALAEAIG